MNFEEYKKLIIEIQRQNPIEIELYPVISQVIRENISEEICVRAVWTLNKECSIKKYIQDNIVPDLLLVPKEYIASKNKYSQNIVIGSAEIKRCNVNFEDCIDQADVQKDTYNNTIYTNGLIWRFYKKGSTEYDEFILKDISKKQNYLSILDVDNINDFNEFWNKGWHEDKWKELLKKLTDFK